jgi:plastocyanin domain-containing protein
MLFINLVGVGLIALIVWWFWLYKPKAMTQLSKDLVVTVDNGVYSPARITLKRDVEHSLQFLRKDASPCAEMLVIPKLDISETLSVNKQTTIKLPKMGPGSYEFHCQMKMYKGLLLVE